MECGKDLALLLLGRTGSGKSATGNSILGFKAFRSIATIDSLINKSQKEVTELDNGRRLSVVDTPGVGDTRGSEADGEVLFLDTIKEAIAMNPEGYHAILLVLRFGSRYTQEDIDTIAYLKSLFGEKFVQKHCIIIMTHGDCFKAQQEEGEIEVTFEEWCKQQKGFFKEMYQEVNGRVILFVNRWKSDVKAQQRQQLISMVDLLTIGGRRYTNDKFHKAQKAHNQKANDRLEKAEREIEGLHAQLAEHAQTLDQKKSDRLEKAEREIERLRAQLDEHAQALEKKNDRLEKAEREIEGLHAQLADYAQDQGQSRKVLDQPQTKSMHLEILKKNEQERSTLSLKINILAKSFKTVQSETDHLPLSSADDRSKSEPHTELSQSE